MIGQRVDRTRFACVGTADERDFLTPLAKKVPLDHLKNSTVSFPRRRESSGFNKRHFVTAGFPPAQE